MRNLRMFLGFSVLAVSIGVFAQQYKVVNHISFPGGKRVGLSFCRL